jgi:hypothetical protein
VTAPSSSDIDDIWDERVWNHAMALAMTSRHFPYDVSDATAFEMGDLYHETPGDMPTINFFLCLATRVSNPNQVGGGGGNGTRYTYTVRVEYYLQQTDRPQETHRLHRDRLEAIDDLMKTQLGKRWGDLVDYWAGGVLVPTTKVVIDDQTCWRGGYTYTALKTT